MSLQLFSFHSTPTEPGRTGRCAARTRLTRLALAAAAALAMAGLTPSVRAQVTPAVVATAATAGANTPASAATTRTTITVLAAHPVVVALATSLAQGSGITLTRAAPANIPPLRQHAYWTGRGATTLQAQASAADAVIALRSLWPDDPLYPLARRSNIRIVEIDAARPVDGALPGVALQGGDARGLAACPWLDPVNLGRMANVLANELGRLAPAARPVVDSNLAQLKHQLVALAAQTESRLAGAGNVSVFSLSDRVAYLVSGLNLDPAGSDTRDDAAWTPAAAQDLVARLRQQQVAAVLHHQAPPAALAEALQAAQLPLVVLATEGADPLGELQANTVALLKALVR